MMHEGPGGFRFGRLCIDNIFSLNELIQGRIKEGKPTYAFFLDVKKPETLCGGMGYDTKFGNWLLKVRCGE